MPVQHLEQVKRKFLFEMKALPEEDWMAAASISAPTAPSRAIGGPASLASAFDGHHEVDAESLAHAMGAALLVGRGAPGHFGSPDIGDAGDYFAPLDDEPATAFAPLLSRALVHAAAAAHDRPPPRPAWNASMLRVDGLGAVEPLPSHSPVAAAAPLPRAHGGGGRVRGGVTGGSVDLRGDPSVSARAGKAGHGLRRSLGAEEGADASGGSGTTTTSGTWLPAGSGHSAWGGSGISTSADAARSAAPTGPALPPLGRPRLASHDVFERVTMPTASSTAKRHEGGDGGTGTGGGLGAPPLSARGAQLDAGKRGLALGVSGVSPYLGPSVGALPPAPPGATDAVFFRLV
jgi:hypothetical protein